MSVPEPQPATPKPRFQYSLRTLLLFVTICAIILGCWRWLHPIYSLFQPDDVISMEVLWFCDGHRDWSGLELSEKQWRGILAALSPSEYDPSPCNWQVLAAIEIHTKNNERFRLGAYYLPSEPIGAFSVGPTFEQRSYRRGGNSDRLKEVLANAYAEFEAKKKAAAFSQ